MNEMKTEVSAKMKIFGYVARQISDGEIQIPFLPNGTVVQVKLNPRRVNPNPPALELVVNNWDKEQCYVSPNTAIKLGFDDLNGKILVVSILSHHPLSDEEGIKT